jgi:hypothetical protein
MIVILNIFIILLILLIGYWWGNQGLFSAILHLLCVIAAGALAFAFWEVVTVNMLLRGNRFDDYAWGISLLGMFTVFLLGLRLASDYGIKSNVSLPDWANLTFGFLVGMVSGVLTLGMLTIGAGFMQSHQNIAGYTGYGVSRSSGNIERLGQPLWIPVHRITNDFYNLLSVGALHPTFEGRPMQHVNPDLYQQMSLLRASFGQGRGKFSLLPDAGNVTRVTVDENTNRHLVTVEFSALARDFGQQMTLSRSQVRLICHVSSSSQSKPKVVFADAFQQETSNHPWGRYLWDDPSHYAHSIPGRDSARIIFEFPVPPGERGQYIQIRGTRFALPPAERVAGAQPQTAPANTRQPPVIGTSNRIDSQIDVSERISPVVASINRLPGNLKHVERRLTEGSGRFPRGGGERPSRPLRVDGVYEPAGTKAVQVDVSRGTPADIFGPIRAQSPPDSEIALVDDRGNTYPPVGYLHVHTEGIDLLLDPVRYVRAASQLPLLPTAGSDQLRLIFYVTQGVTIVGLQYGDRMVGVAEVAVD